MLKFQKVGGLYHWRVGRLGGSFYLAARRGIDLAGALAMLARRGIVADFQGRELFDCVTGQTIARADRRGEYQASAVKAYRRATASAYDTGLAASQFATMETEMVFGIGKANLCEASTAHWLAAYNWFLRSNALRER